MLKNIYAVGIAYIIIVFLDRSALHPPTRMYVCPVNYRYIETINIRKIDKNI